MENKFQENISNEDVSLLPISQFQGDIVVVDTPEAAKKACDDLLSHKVIGFDSETRPSFKAGVINKVALLQLSTPGKCYLFRLSKMALHKPILSVLESKKTLKIGADVANDIKALQALRHFRPNGFIDLQNIISEWGVAEKSVRKMSGIVLGCRISKAQRLSNWEAAALTPAQQRYAATDAWICVEIYNKLLATNKKELAAKTENNGQDQVPNDTADGAKTKKHPGRFKPWRRKQSKTTDKTGLNTNKNPADNTGRAKHKKAGE